MASMQDTDWELMKIVFIQASHVDFAWRDGASKLAEACKHSGNEITGDQLKMLFSRGERMLVRMDDDSKTVGWAGLRVDQLPNVRVMHVCDLYAPHGRFELFFEELKKLAFNTGCSKIRCAAKPAQARLYKMKLGFQSVYETLEIEV